MASKRQLAREAKVQAHAAERRQRQAYHQEQLAALLTLVSPQAFAHEVRAVFLEHSQYPCMDDSYYVFYQLNPISRDRLMDEPHVDQ